MKLTRFSWMGGTALAVGLENVLEVMRGRCLSEELGENVSVFCFDSGHRTMPVQARTCEYGLAMYAR